MPELGRAEGEQSKNPGVASNPSLSLLIVVHNHQPVGNFDPVLEDAFHRCYGPFLEAVERHPAVRLTLHYSGYLLEWLAERHPKFIDRLRALVGRGQVELLGGGLYEPILAAIPEVDKIGQIRAFAGMLEERIGARPRGLWLAERVWEPHLPRSLSEAGAEYTVLDDSHFLTAGLSPNRLSGWFITEEEGSHIGVFPGSERLRYLFPFRPIREAEEHLRALGPSAMAVYADDGEKFGLWPGTHDLVYGKGWLEQFLGWIESGSAWLRTETLGEYHDRHAPAGRAYLPTASYIEMAEWALDLEASRTLTEIREEAARAGEENRLKPRLAGAFWRNFLTKYPEADAMHKRMLWISQRVRHEAERPAAPWPLSPVHRELYLAQCNDAYWHGVFGGLYLPHLRREVYHHLIRAECLLDRKAGNRPRVWEKDLDADGRPEVWVATPRLGLLFRPDRGGTLAELDDREPALNLLNVLTRREEPYHRKIRDLVTEAKEGRSIHNRIGEKSPGLSQLLRYDRAPRASLRDRIFPPEATIEQASREHVDLSDLGGRGYRYRTATGVSRIRITLEGEGQVRWKGGTLPARVEKTVEIPEPYEELVMQWRVLCSGGPGLKFASEWNLSGLEGPPPIGASPPLDPGASTRCGMTEACKEFFVAYPATGLRLAFSWDPPCALWWYPIQTVSLSEGGLEPIFQGLCLLPVWDLPPAGALVAGARLRLVRERPA